MCKRYATRLHACAWIPYYYTMQHDGAAYTTARATLCQCPRESVYPVKRQQDRPVVDFAVAYSATPKERGLRSRSYGC